MGVQDYTENLKFLYEYLSETNYELAEKLSRFIRDGIGKPEILLESAVYASFNKAYCNSAFLLLEAYEAYLLEAGSDLYPFMIYAVREEILKNMINAKSNTSSKSLYLLKMSNGTVKIGIAADVEKRVNQLKHASGMDIEKILFTDNFDDSEKLENLLHKKYKNCRKNGEYFLCKFSDVEKDIIKLAKEKNVKIHRIS